MLELAVSAAVGALTARLAWTATRPWFARPALVRPNYRGHGVPTAAGLVLTLALFAVEAARTVLGAGFGAGFGTGVAAGVGQSGARLLVLVAVTGFCLLGAVDDVAGSSDDRGFRGHVRALARGRVTTGGLKLLGGAAVALVAVGPLALRSAPDGAARVTRLLADAALVALAANLGNLLDRAPGRTIKGALLAFALVVAASGAEPGLAGVAVVAGAAAGLLVDDLRERLMLGDAGANSLGAAVGLGAVLAFAPLTRNLVLGGLLVLNLLGELVSFSRVIDGMPPLRALDRLGRRPASDR
jgi:UDP-N-acetylmuramyl pentapeptide phosphotransferase/UDP-N-acetylglucosamine-1-phosphate transferase